MNSSDFRASYFKLKPARPLISIRAALLADAALVAAAATLYLAAV